MNRYDEELYHYGVPGMKWGRRKASYDGGDTRSLRSGTKRINSTRNAMQARKRRYLSNEQSDRAFDSTYKSTYNKLTKSGMRKGKAQNKAMDAAIKESRKVESKIQAAYKSDMKKLKADHKLAKKEGKKDRKKDLKEAYKAVKKSSSLGEKIVFNRATRKKAAKYVVDNNMSLEAAKSAANAKAIRNTAIILGGVGAYSIRKLRK